MIIDVSPVRALAEQMIHGCLLQVSLTGYTSTLFERAFLEFYHETVLSNL